MYSFFYSDINQCNDSKLVLICSIQSSLNSEKRICFFKMYVAKLQLHFSWEVSLGNKNFNRTFKLCGELLHFVAQK